MQSTRSGDECAAAPWLGWLRAFGGSPPPGHDHDLVRRARRTLRRLWRAQALAERGAVARAAIGRWQPPPAAVAGDPPRPRADGAKVDRKPARTLREMSLDRDAVLSLGVWHVLGQGAGGPGDGFDRLIPALSRRMHELPAALRPATTAAPSSATPAFAFGPDAAVFFNLRVRGVLRNLARLYDPTGADFEQWAALPDYAGDSGSVEPWSRAWSLCAAATYADWLRHASDGTLVHARRQVLSGKGPNFRPPQAIVRAAASATPRPAVLPTDARRLHLVLRLRLLLAQVLDYDAARWSRPAPRRFDVALSLKTLGQQDSGRWDAEYGARRARSRYRGLRVGQLYAAVFVECMFGLQDEASR